MISLSSIHSLLVRSTAPGRNFVTQTFQPLGVLLQDVTFEIIKIFYYLNEEIYNQWSLARIIIFIIIIIIIIINYFYSLSAIFQSVTDVKLTGVAPLGAVSHIFN